MENRKGVFVGGGFIDEDRMMNGIQEEVVDDFAEEEVVVKAKPKAKVVKAKRVVAKPVSKEVSKEVSVSSKEVAVKEYVGEIIIDVVEVDSEEYVVEAKEDSEEEYEMEGRKYKECVDKEMERKKLEFEIEIKLSKLAPIMDEYDRIYLEHIKVRMRNERVIRNINDRLSAMDAKAKRIFSRVNSKLKKECLDKIFAIDRQLHLHNPLWEFNSKCESLGLDPDAVRDELSLRRGGSIVPYHIL